MSYRDISSYLEDIYQVDISTATISAIKDKTITKWQAENHLNLSILLSGSMQFIIKLKMMVSMYQRLSIQFSV